MTAQIIDGKAIAATLLDSIKLRIDARLKANRRAPSLAVVLIGGDPASAIYVRNKRLACEKVGIKSLAYDLPSSTSEAELLKLIKQLNEDITVDGILVQSPLPAHIKDEHIIEQISPETSHHEATNITKNKQEVIHIEEDNSYLSFVNPFY